MLGVDGLLGYYWEYKGGKYYYLETTGEGFGLGELPDAYVGVSASIYELTPVPIIDHSWEGTSLLSSYALNITVENLGTATATNIYVYAGFQASEGQLWNVEQSDPFNLAVGEVKKITLKLTSPSDVYTRILIQIVDDGYSVSESYSEWFDT